MQEEHFQVEGGTKGSSFAHHQNQFSWDSFVCVWLCDVCRWDSAQSFILTKAALLASHHVNSQKQQSAAGSPGPNTAC